jgi:Ca-activated chloride channel family protein
MVCFKTILMILPLSFLVREPLAQGQTPSPTGGTTISVNVNLVLLRITVRDRKGGFVAGLNKSNFRVVEDRAPQTIRFFQHEDVPVAVGLIVDNSGSMGRKRKDVTAAALTFVRASNPDDEIFVVNFNEHVSLGLPDTTLFSASTEELDRALNGIPASGKTALYDAIEAGVMHLKKATIGKKVLIVISDGGDNASHSKLEGVLEAASRADITIYTVGLFDEDDHDRNPGILRKIAHATGGEAFLPGATSEIVPICKRIAEDIRNQYTIGYVSTNQNLDNTYRKIQVTAAGQRHERYLVRTRARYIASSVQSGAAQHSQESPR